MPTLSCKPWPGTLEDYSCSLLSLGHPPPPGTKVQFLGLLSPAGSHLPPSSTLLRSQQLDLPPGVDLIPSQAVPVCQALAPPCLAPFNTSRAPVLSVETEKEIPSK